MFDSTYCFHEKYRKKFKIYLFYLDNCLYICKIK
nr:MAG TPA: Pleckstrin homology domain [Bacteriophage sp.]